ncbi:hypothetical protein P3342_009349 [Pyrenophora teres f. teres]|nr:hypothetical protein P3342_009349 [Pyrenophora teres f. teres]
MSLFSSFIIDPVVRHARRFSGAVPPGEASVDGARFLACDNRDSAAAAAATGAAAAAAVPPPDCETGASTVNTLQRVDVADAEEATGTRPTALMDRFRRYSSFSQRPRSAVVDEEEQSDEALPPIDIPVQMSANPSPSLADQFRHRHVAAGDDSTNSSRLNTPPTSSLHRTPSTGSQHAAAMSESLPADDGMAHLRARIHEIRALDISDHERARMIHAVMTESTTSCGRRPQQASYHTTALSPPHPASRSFPSYTLRRPTRPRPMPMPMFHSTSAKATQTRRTDHITTMMALNMVRTRTRTLQKGRTCLAVSTTSATSRSSASSAVAGIPVAIVTMQLKTIT